MKNNNVKIKRKFSIFNSIVMSILIVNAFILFFALYWMICMSLKSETEIDTNFFGLPDEWLFSNLIKAFKSFQCSIPTADDNVGLFPTMHWDIGLYPGILINTLLYTVGGAICSTIVPCLVSYTVAKFDYKFSKFLYVLVIITMILPIVGSFPAMVKVMYSLNIYNTILGGWIQKCNFLGMYFLIFYASFKSIPNDYMEAAYIDGANEWKVLFRIILPLVRPIFLTICIIHFIDIWNDYQTVLLYLPSYPTISMAVYKQVIIGGIPAMSPPQFRMAACMIMVVPTVTLFIIFREKLMGNLSLGGLKG